MSAIKPDQAQVVFLVARGQIAVPNKKNIKGPPSLISEGEHFHPGDVDIQALDAFLASGRVTKLSRSNDFEAKKIDELLNPDKPELSHGAGVSVPKGSMDLDPVALEELDFDSLVKVYKDHTKREGFPDTKKEMIAELSANYIKPVVQAPEGKVPEPIVDLDPQAAPPPLES